MTALTFIAAMVAEMASTTAWGITRIVDAPHPLAKRHDPEKPTRVFDHVFIHQHSPTAASHHGDLYIPAEGRYVEIWYTY